MAGWHPTCNGNEPGQTPGDGEGQGSLVACGPWGCKELDTTGQLNNNNFQTLRIQVKATWRKSRRQLNKVDGRRAGWNEPLRRACWDFPVCPVAKTPPSDTGDTGRISGLGTKIPQATVKTRHSHK